MIKHLQGIHETVNYKPNTQICLYRNDEEEDYPPHWHTPFEIIMPIESTYRACCGERAYMLREKDVLIICPGIIHELFAPPEGVRIIFQPNMSQMALREVDFLISMIMPAILITPEAYPGIHEKIHRLMLEIMEEYFSSDPYSETAIYSKFMEILVCVGRNHAQSVRQNFDARDGKQKEYIEKFKMITDYVNEHFTEDLTLEQMASMAGFSKYHFTRLFKQYTDMSFYRYLNEKRISYARSLLLDPNLTVIEVAIRSGFTSLSAFLRMFKLINQYTPTEFRRMYTNPQP
ncbi:MAG TPA: helix-turn-helix transcriptional regulator [Candidatus Limivivens intestinipullorum]|uniref:Helix-turn-helix transcriptional regulator n=1 Tax=Candidatus Limivivens intestinipullorum TaxID=2840858 RepID=A0A9D1ETE9_9FIRM|nr:helix-turn-helix transcriptional regulator [Candidatus Limivivens intestinipullorum]